MCIRVKTFKNGWVAEWLKAHAWKVCLGRKPNGGSNPLPSAKEKPVIYDGHFYLLFSPIVQKVILHLALIILNAIFFIYHSECNEESHYIIATHQMLGAQFFARSRRTFLSDDASSTQ